MNSVGLYLHIPFCHAKCGYCDFATFAGLDHKIESYLEALQCEIKKSPQASLSTLFIGGGTPTVLSPQQITGLFTALRAHFDFSPLTEATVEANPESATVDVLTAYRQNGINRISFGLQTTDEALLKTLDRLHSYTQFLEAYQRARQIGFSNINIDLIFGLPGQTLKTWEKTLNEVLTLAPEHISAYALKVESGTKFAAQHVKADDDLEADMYLLTSEKLRAAGYEHYEISNFCKPGHASQHNLKYWKNENTLGLGLSSASYQDGTRLKNTTALQTYIDRMMKGESAVTETHSLLEDQRQKEVVMLGLRLQEGVAVDTIAAFKIPMFDTFVKNNFAFVEAGFYRLNSQGWLLSNQLFEKLIV